MNYTLKNLGPIYKRLKMMIKQLLWTKNEDIDTVINELKRGRAVGGTSDTVLGLMADCSLEGFTQLNFLKRRNEQPYLILLESQEKLSHFVSDEILFQVENMLKFFWPGPLTVIMPAKDEIPDYMKSRQGTIALRVPQHDGLQKLLAQFIGIFSTSANKSGEPVPLVFENVDSFIVKNISYWITDPNPHHALIPSTIIEWANDHVKLIREGAYRVDDLRKVLQKPLIVPERKL